MNIDSNKFKKWLTSQGVEILPNTNEHESVRFKGRETGVLYKSGKTSNVYALKALVCFTTNTSWDGKPINVGRNKNYHKEKIKLLKRDGDLCFYCYRPLNSDITIEHLIALSSGGKNTLANMVLAHEKCNNSVKNQPISNKVKYAIKHRLKYCTLKSNLNESDS